MANHYRVSPKFWLWSRRRGLTDAQEKLALYLLTCEHRNLEGLYRLPKAYMADDLGWTVEKVVAELEVILESGFAMYDEAAHMVLIPKALKHQQPSTDNQIKGAIAQLRRIPRTSLWDAFRIACRSHCPKLAEAIEMEWPPNVEPPPRAKTDATPVASASHSNGALAGAPARAPAGPSSSSISSSISSPPQPPAERGEQVCPEGASLETPSNSRAHGTNPRARAKRHLAAVADQRAALAVASFAQPSDTDREGWGRLHTALHQAVGDNDLLAGYVSEMRLVAVDGGVLVLDAPDGTWTWAAQRFQEPIAKWAEHVGVPARLASLDEHKGMAEVVA